MIKSRTRGSLFIFLLFTSVIYSQIPRVIAYQGILTDSHSNLMPDGYYFISIGLFTDSLGGTSLWNQSESLYVYKGVFNTLLGSKTPLNLPFNQEYWLSVSIKNKELSPRIRLASVGYCLRADTANIAKMVDGTAIVNKTVDGSKIKDSSITGVHINSNGDFNIGTLTAKGIFSSGFPDDYNAGNLNLVNLTNNRIWQLTMRSKENDKLQLHYFDSTSWHESYINVSTNGDVGIGNNNPKAPLSFANITGNKIDFYHTQDDRYGIQVQPSELRIHSGFRGDLTGGITFGKATSDNFTEFMRIRNDGNVGIGTSEPSEKLEVNGNIQANSCYALSDLRLKTSISKLDACLDKISHLNGIYYEWDRDSYPERNFPEGKQIGLIAQEVEKVIPEVVSTNKDGYKSLDYDKLVAVLIEAVKEQKKHIEKLEREVEMLKKR